MGALSATDYIGLVRPRRYPHEIAASWLAVGRLASGGTPYVRQWPIVLCEALHSRPGVELSELDKAFEVMDKKLDGIIKPLIIF